MLACPSAVSLSPELVLRAISDLTEEPSLLVKEISPIYKEAIIWTIDGDVDFV